MTDSPSTMPTAGRWGWYQDHEGREYRRVSKLLEYIETKPGSFNLRKWDDREAAIGFALRDDLVLALKAMPRPGPEGYSRVDKDKIADIVKDARTAAKQRDGARSGTAYHDLTERYDRGESAEDIAKTLPSDAAQAVLSYAFLIEQNGWTVLEIERTVQCEELGDVTGSLDRVYEVPGLAELLGPGTCQHGHTSHDESLPVIGDVKTEAKPWLNGMHIAPQLAIYARSRKVWRATGGTHRATIGSRGYEREVDLPNGAYEPSRCVRQDVGVVVHVHEGHAHPYFVNIAAGWRAAERAYEQMLDEQAAKRDLGAAGAWFMPLPGIREPKPAELLTQVAALKQYGRPDRPAEPPQYAVGDVVSVGGVDFVKHSDGAVLGVPAAPPALMMVAGEVAHEPGDTLTQGNVVTHIAARRDDGLVEWRPVGDVNGQPEPAADRPDLPKMLIAQIWQAATVERLGELWQLAEANAVPWRGPVEQAGDARRRQIECPQRALHSGAGRCACGWMTGVAA